MKILLVGVGGIGSWLVEHINGAYENFQLDTDIEVEITDPDTVEIKNIKYQNFNKADVLENKAKMLKKRYEYIAKAMPKKVDQIRTNYDLYILAVDNFATRKQIIEHCYNKKKGFIDLRAEGRNIFAIHKGDNLTEDLETLGKSKESGSCQRPDEFNKNIIQYGNHIAASLGIQMLLNYLRDDIKQRRFLLRI